MRTKIAGFDANDQGTPAEGDTWTWDATNKRFRIATPAGGIDVQEDGVSIVDPADTIDFDGDFFVVTNPSAGKAYITLAAVIVIGGVLGFAGMVAAAVQSQQDIAFAGMVAAASVV